MWVFSAFLPFCLSASLPLCFSVSAFVCEWHFVNHCSSAMETAGLTLETNGGQAHAIPEGTYDVGDGYLDPKTNKVMDYNGSFLRDADEEEQTWAKTFCRVGKESHVDSSHAQWTKKSPSPK